MGKPVVHFEIWAQQDKATAEFYSKLFDWEINFQAPMNYGLIQTKGEGGIDGGIMKPQPGPVPSSHLTFYVLVEDLKATLDKANELGGETVLGPTPIPGVGSMALFKDPEGNTIGLWHQEAKK